VVSPPQYFTGRENQCVFGPVLPTMDLHSGLINRTVDGGVDSRFFTIDRTNGSLQLVEPADCETPHDTEGDSVFELRVRIHSESASEVIDVSVNVQNVAEEISPHTLVFLQDTRTNRIVTFSPDTNEYVVSSISPNGLRAVATADGRTFYHVHLLNNGPALFRSVRSNDGTFRSVLVNANCAELIGIHAWATTDGTKFVALREATGGRSLVELRVNRAGGVEQLGEWEIGSALPETFCGLTQPDAGWRQLSSLAPGGMNRKLQSNVIFNQEFDNHLSPVAIVTWGSKSNDR
jgi:hypothetical protein